MQNSMLRNFLIAALAFILAVSLPAVSFAANGFRYEHDPRLNPSAMADITEDENAIYGFRPSETGSLKAYAAYDWSDPDIVGQGRQDRIAYHESLASMYEMLEEMTSRGEDIETVARAISARRNELRFEAYKDDPEGLATLKERNMEKYGHEEGPLPDEQFEKYGSWETVIKKAFSANSGMDACLGLYDDYYYLYVASGEVTDDAVPHTGDTQETVFIVAAALAFAGAVSAAARRRKAF